MYRLKRLTVLCACIICLAVAATACSTSKSEQTDDEQPESGPPALPEHEDSGPLLSRDTTPLEIKTSEGLTLTADAANQQNGVTYLRVTFPKDFDNTPLPNLDDFTVNVRGMQLADHRALIGFKEAGHAADDPDTGEPVGTDEPALYLRINATDLPDTLELRVVRFVETTRQKESDPVGHLTRRTWKIDTTGGLNSEPNIADVARIVIADRFQHFGYTAQSPADEFFAYTNHRLLERSKLAAHHSREDDFDHEEWIADSMSNLTGREAITETLQADRQIQAVDRNKSGGIDVDDIDSLELPEHPWRRLLSEQKNDDQQAVSTEPVARFAPSNRIYARFDSLEAFIGMLDDAGATLAPMLGSFSNARALDELIDRYERQLGIDASLFAEHFGDLAVDDVALLLDDPYLASGTAVAIIFKTDNPDLVNTLLDKQLQEARSGIQTDEKTTDIRGRKVRSVDSPDHRLSHVRTSVEGAVILSNSPAPIRAALETLDGDSPSIADDSGFKFMRHFYPPDDEQRTGFFYIGEDFVRRFTSPRYRIAQSRRSRAHANLQALHYRTMFHSLLDGQWPQKPGALFDSQQHKQALEHADGTKILFDLNGGASSTWGRPDWMRPISEIEIQGVTKAEKRAYEQFRNEYSRLGHRYIDPIAVSLTHRNGETTFDVRVTPLHQSSDYRELADLVGKAHLYDGPDTTGLQWSFGIGEDADFRRWTRRAATRMMFGREVTVDWLGSWGAMGIGDRSGAWDAAILFDAIPVRGEDPMRPSTLDDKKIKALNRFPAWVALEVKSQVGFAAFIGGVRRFLEEVAPNTINWSKGEPYRETDITRIELSPTRQTTTPFTVSYTLVNGVFLMSVDRSTLKHRIDAVKAGYTPRPAPTLRKIDDTDPSQEDEDDNGDTNEAASTDRQSSKDTEQPTPDGPQMALSLRLSSDDSWLKKTLFGLIENAQLYLLPGTATTHFAAANIWPDRTAKQLASTAASWWGVNLQNHHARFANLGPHGGVVDPLYGVLPMRNYYGNPAPFQTLPDLPVTKSPVTDWLSGLQVATFDISFEQHGQALGLHTRATFEWTPQPSDSTE